MSSAELLIRDTVHGITTPQVVVNRENLAAPQQETGHEKNPFVMFGIILALVVFVAWLIDKRKK